MNLLPNRKYIFRPSKKKSMSSRGFWDENNFTLRTSAVAGASESILSSANSSTTPLANGESFIGEGELVSAPDVFIGGKTDTNGDITISFSADGVNYDSNIPYQYAANTAFAHKFIKGYRYFRLKFYLQIF